MPIFIAYAVVVLIWSTTPLAVVWSNEGLSFSAAVTLRMVLAFLVASVVMLLTGDRIRLGNGNWKVYSVASFGLFPNMLLIYWSAQFISSGLLALIFGMSPFFTGVLSWVIVRENGFTWHRVLSLPFALAGLALVFRDSLNLGPDAVYGVLGMLLSCVLFAVTGIWMKKMNSSLGAINQTTGAIGFSLPGFILTWYLVDGTIPETLPMHSIYAVLYLALMGSLVGIALFIYLIKHISMESVSLITMMSPVIALFIGFALAGERMSITLALGASLILLSLVFYQGFGFSQVKRWLTD